MTASRKSELVDERWMKLALREAALGKPSPNPHVGAVIVRGGKMIGKGHHHKAGEDHAEIAAMKSVKGSLRGTTLYCTLVPCNHVGRTGPCVDQIIASGIKRVVIGADDPTGHAKASIEKLRRAKIEVLSPVLAAETNAMIADFTRHAILGMPFARVKAAMTLDGFVATRDGDSKWITSDASRREAHKMRAWADAVLVGVETVLADDPSLTVRHVRGIDPIRTVLDTSLRTPTTSLLVRTAREIPTWIFHGPKASARARKTLAGAGVTLIETALDRNGHVDLRRVLRALAKRDVVRLLVEGGGKIHGAFLSGGFAQRISLFVAPRILGDADGRPVIAGAPRKRIRDAIDVSGLSVRKIGPDLLLEGAVE